MRLTDVIWKHQFVEKLALKHRISVEEAEDVLFSKRTHFKRVQKGRVRSEDLYSALGQTGEGRYIVVFFVCKQGTNALPISARDMSGAERGYYEKKR